MKAIILISSVVLIAAIGICVVVGGTKKEQPAIPENNKSDKNN